jgi:hypothetical protein
VKAECDWRGRHGIIIQDNPQSGTIILKLVRSSSEENDIIEIPRENVFSVAETGMMRLLERVRWDYIPLGHLRTELREAEIRFASGFECYKQLICQTIQRRSKSSLEPSFADHPREGYDDPVARDDPLQVLAELLVQSPSQKKT